MAEPPLVQAIAQVRFPIQATWQTLAGIAPLQELLRADFPIMEPQQIAQLQISIGPAPELPASPFEPTVNWLFQGADDGYQLVVGPSSASLAIGTDYTNVADFGAKFEGVLSALAATGLPPRCDRLGVRYLDLVECTSGEDESPWQDYFRPELLGWIGAGILRPDAQLNSALTQVQIAGPGITDDTELQGVVHHGVVPPGVVVAGMPPIQRDNPAFILDLDLFVPTLQPFNVRALREQFDFLHDQIDRFFRWALTEAGEVRFGLEEVAAP